MKKVFFDASVIFSSLYSKKGGSFRLTTLIKEKKIIGITSETVITEVKDNFHKLKTETVHVEQFIVENNFLVRQKITEKEIAPYRNLVDIKDAHVVAGAILTDCQYLVTLDKKHLNNQKVSRKIKGIKIVSPKKFLKDY